jgi:hypothetical protein
MPRAIRAVERVAEMAQWGKKRDGNQRSSVGFFYSRKIGPGTLGLFCVVISAAGGS